MGDPVPGHVAGEEEFSWRKDKSGERKVKAVDERAEGKVSHRGQHDGGHHFLSQDGPGDDVHHEKEEQEYTESGEEVRCEMVEVEVKGAVGGVNEAVRENGDPQGKRDIADAPEGMQHIFSCHELSEEQHDKTFHHAALESIPGKQAGNMDTQKI